MLIVRRMYFLCLRTSRSCPCMRTILGDLRQERMNHWRVRLARVL